MRIGQTSLELFLGTGGVGKTTLATARALALAQAGQRVLLITIDPSRRLKDYFGLGEADFGQVCTVKLGERALDLILHHPMRALERLLRPEQSAAIANNRILTLLTGPYGALFELVGLVELNYFLQRQEYDVILLDTAPGKHFIDFLTGLEVIQPFFDSRWPQVITLIGQGLSSATLLEKIFYRGVEKLFSYIGEITGSDFLKEFLAGLQIIFSLREHFMATLNLQMVLQDSGRSRWWLVTTPEIGRCSEGLVMFRNISKVYRKNCHVILNRSQQEELAVWQNKTPNLLAQSLLFQEERVHEMLKKHFKDILVLPELKAKISERDPLRALTELARFFDH